MTDQLPQPEEDPRISKLRIRIKRMSTFVESEKLLVELIDLGHAAQPLISDIAEKIGKWSYSDKLPELICNLKNEVLLKAAQANGIQFQPYRQAELLTAGFAEFERPLVDYLWGMKNSNCTGMYSSILDAIGKYARLPETLDTLRALESDIFQRLKAVSEINDDIESKKNLGEPPVDKDLSSMFEEIGIACFCKTLRKCIKTLQDRRLIGELPNVFNIAEIESVAPPSGLVDLISKGEYEYLEFKSTLRFDLRQDKINDALEMAVIKTIAAFANSKGGTLLIGIDDKGNPLGLAKDYSTLTKKTGKDGFELHLINLLNTHLGKANAANIVKISFPNVKDIEICSVEVMRSNDPLFVRDKGPETFYIRIGNSSQSLLPSEMLDYLKKRN